MCDHWLEFQGFFIYLFFALLYTTSNHSQYFFRKITTHCSNLRSQTYNSPHKPHLHFLKRNGPYFHEDYAPKIESGASHNIKFKKTEFSQKITSKIFLKSFFWKSIHVYTFFSPKLEIHF